MALELYRGRNAARIVNQKQYVLFHLEDVFYCLPIECVREIVVPQSIIRVPHTPTGILGVCYYRGDVVPILNLRTQFGLSPLTDIEAQKRVKWIMALVGYPSGSASKMITLVVDRVHYVFATSETPKPAPSLGAGENEHAISGVLPGTVAGLSPSSIVFVLDTDCFRHILEPVSPDEGSLL